MTYYGNAIQYPDYLEDEPISDISRVIEISASTSGSSGVAQKKYLGPQQYPWWIHSQAIQPAPLDPGRTLGYLNQLPNEPKLTVVVTTGTLPGWWIPEPWAVRVRNTQRQSSLFEAQMPGLPLLHQVGFSPTSLFEENTKDPTADAWAIVQTVSNKEVASVAENLLRQLREYLSRVANPVLPSLSAIELDDGSLLIEWTTIHWRIGFRVELISQDSSWTLVSDKVFGEVNAFGDLLSVNLKWLVEFTTNPRGGWLHV